MSIAILLPFKENYSSNLAGAVSLFINDINIKSRYKEKTTIYGSTDENKYLSNNYINIKIKKKILLKNKENLFNIRNLNTTHFAIH